MVGSLLAGKINPFQQERVKKKSVRVCILDGDTSDLFLQINVVYSVIKIKKPCNLLDLLLPVSIHCEEIRLSLSAVLHGICRQNCLYDMIT
jgi:hypothetical protein